ncbi:uncharacterized protein Tco025E_07043 [Trypanosoma conorhini]|uniref:PA domain-containing protein n=1 Tax=Trypanosoma conorhini TaxID=83891 RepID=A0A3R7L7P1_9TRYP|nr:uncharacterized protein Tco025E_07043 [Trypanosoma conorhini]RNF09273.1 hypothetical protein Tco025E_07043 [Trypanosoma conorhini]
MACSTRSRWLRLLALTLLLAVAGSAAGVRVNRPAFLTHLEHVGRKLSVGPPRWSGREYSGEILLVRGAELCPNTTSSGNWNGAIVLALDNKCDTVDQAVVAQGKGALGLLLASSNSSLRAGGDVRIPVEVLPSKEYNAIVATVNEGIPVHVSIGRSLNVLRFAV